MTSGPSLPVVWVGVHDLSRTGVPVVLGRLLRALSPGERSAVHVVAIRDGVLAGELAQSCASLTTLQPETRRSRLGAAEVGLEELGAARVAALVRRAEWGVRLTHLPRPDVVVVHGAGAWQVAVAAPGSPAVIVHLHELRTGLDRSIPPSLQPSVLGGARRVLVVSRAVADLAVRRGASSERVEVVPGMVEPPAPAEIGIPVPADDERWVMGAGTPGWRKGTDRVAALAHSLARTHRGLCVGWVGGRPSGADAIAVGAHDPVRWFEARPDPWAVLQRSEVMVVPSREDPLPLVALEAGIRARPVVALPTGGLADLLGGGRGLVGPSHDVGWLVESVADLLDRPEHARALGVALREHVQREFLAERIAPMWWAAVSDAAG